MIELYNFGKSEGLSAEAIKTSAILARRRGDGGAAAAPTATLATGKMSGKSVYGRHLSTLVTLLSLKRYPGKLWKK